jgi:hypothetical protein
MKLLYLFGIICMTSIVFSQESTFYGYVSPSAAMLVPEPKTSHPKQEIVIPNFKGRELPVQLGTNTYQPDWVWQQHSSNQQKTTSASLL